ncbi:ribonuclease H-like domain-containing protein [Tanacetum coccineum]
MFTCTLAQYVAYKTNVAQQFTSQKHYRLPHPGQGILDPTPAIYASQPTPLPSAFSTMPLQDPTWHMDTGASSHLNFNASNLSTIFYKHLFPSVYIGDGKSIPVTNTCNSIIPSHHRPLHLHNVLDYLTRHILIRCDGLSDLYQVTKPSTSPIAFLSTSASTWHQRLEHPGDQHKFHADGTLSRYKAQLVANGSDQQHGVDFDETLSLVVKSATIRTVLSLAVSRQWPIHQLDVKNAFLNGDLSETRSLYGLKQGYQVAYLLIYVDDIILTASSPVLLQQIVDSLHKEFDMTDLGALNYFLGISVVRHPTGLFLSQKKFARQLLERAHMVNCNPSRTPIDTDSKLCLDGVPVQDPTLYRSLAGGLQYLTFTRPDLSYAVQQVCLYMHDPREPHLAALKRILRDVRGTLELGLQLYASATTSLVGYTNADWAGCPSTRRSTSGYCVFLGDNLLSWSAKRQHTISRSSAEAEYQGVANVVAETAWIRNLLRELHSPLLTATLVYCDNVSAVYMSANPVQHQRTKHIEIDIHFVRDMVKAGHVRVLHVLSRFQYADIFTKGLPSALFEDFRSSLSVTMICVDNSGFMCGMYGGLGLMKAQTDAIELYFSAKLEAHPDNLVGFTTMGALGLYCKPSRDPKYFWSTFKRLEFAGSLQQPNCLLWANFGLYSNPLPNKRLVMFAGG